MIKPTYLRIFDHWWLFYFSKFTWCWWF